MGRSFDSENGEVWMERGERRAARRAAREAYLIRGEGTKAVDPSTGLTLSVKRDGAR